VRIGFWGSVIWGLKDECEVAAIAEGDEVPMSHGERMSAEG